MLEVGLLEKGGSKTRAYTVDPITTNQRSITSTSSDELRMSGPRVAVLRGRTALNHQWRLASSGDVNLKGIHVQGQHGVVAHHGGQLREQLGAEVV